GVLPLLPTRSPEPLPALEKFARQNQVSWRGRRSTSPGQRSISPTDATSTQLVREGADRCKLCVSRGDEKCAHTRKTSVRTPRDAREQAFSARCTQLSIIRYLVYHVFLCKFGQSDNFLQ
ncbi:hypothetical protein BE221DRAFT_169663, partial [Ostreococcus tauri]